MVPSPMTKLSFDSGASAWDRFSVRASALFVPALLAAAEITAGQRVLDVATGAGPSALEAAALIAHIPHPFSQLYSNFGRASS